MKSDDAHTILRCEDFVTTYARNTPDAAALVADGHTVSYKTLAEAISRCATGLLQAGVKRGDRVATLSSTTPDFLVTFLGALSVGAIWQGLNPRYQRNELAYAIQDAEPCVVFAPGGSGDNRDYLGELAGIAEEMGQAPLIVDMGKGLDAFSPSADQSALAARREELDGDDPAIIVYTSGSTGAPKGALLKHSAIVSMSQMQNRVWPADPAVSLNFLPINHVGSIVDTTMPLLAAGGTMVLMEQFDPELSLELMEHHGVTVWGSIPSVFHLQLQAKRFPKTDFSAVQLIVWEGAAMPAEMVTQLQSVCTRMATNYGMTETTSAVTILEPTDDIDALTHSVGRPIEGAEVRIADAEGRPLGVGETGEIQSRSDYNTPGYWRREEATREAFTSDGFFKTGDLGQWRKDGRIQIVGRLKEMYKSGGYNVYPREVEDLLERYSGVAEAAVVGVNHPVWGEVGVAFVCASEAVTTEALDAHARSNLANFKIPKAFFVLEAMPLLPIGKVDKQKLCKMAADQMAES
ncbi:MAG: class I adenylate-forming enzyme family protein [Pseudomonadota bacterium]